MTDHADLYLHEELLLLTLRDREGTVVSGAWSAQALAGGILAELVLRGRVRATGAKAKLELVSTEPLGEPLLDECIALLADSEKLRPARTWLARIAGWKKLRHRVAARLCEAGVLHDETEKVLLLFERRTYPEADPAPERAVVERLRRAVFEDGPVDPRTLVLLSVAHRTGILRALFDRKELKARRDRIEAVVAGELAGDAAGRAVSAMQAAMISSTMIAPIIASSGH
jgi:hypothetical protein